MVALNVGVVGGLDREHHDLKSVTEAFDVLRQPARLSMGPRHDVEAAEKHSGLFAHLKPIIIAWLTTKIVNAKKTAWRLRDH